MCIAHVECTFAVFGNLILRIQHIIMLILLNEYIVISHERNGMLMKFITFLSD